MAKRSFNCPACQNLILSFIKPSTKEWERFLKCRCLRFGAKETTKKLYFQGDKNNE